MRTFVNVDGAIFASETVWPLLSVTLISGSLLWGGWSVLNDTACVENPLEGIEDAER